MKVGDFGKPLESGLHLLVLKEIKDDQLTGKGDPMIGLRWQADDASGQVWDNIAINEATGWKMRQLYLALGGSDEDDFESIVEFGDALLDKLSLDATVYATTDIDTYTATKGPDKGLEKTKAIVVEYKPEEEGAVLMQQKPQRDVPF